MLTHQHVRRMGHMPCLLSKESHSWAGQAFSKLPEEDLCFTAKQQKGTIWVAWWLGKSLCGLSKSLLLTYIGPCCSICLSVPSARLLTFNFMFAKAICLSEASGEAGVLSTKGEGFLRPSTSCRPSPLNGLFPAGVPFLLCRYVLILVILLF